MHFIKMQSLGNDFVLFDETEAPVHLTSTQIRQIANRRLGVGCDQVLVIKPLKTTADYQYRIFNADGSEAEQCGNGARCVGRYLTERKDPTKLTWRLLTQTGVVEVVYKTPNEITLLLPPPVIEAPLPGCLGVVRVGNPHVVVEVNDLPRVNLEHASASFTQNKIRFPEGVNVGFLEIKSKQRINLRVFERGAGATQACGSGACAAMVVARCQGLVDESVVVSQPGGELQVFWVGEGDPVHLTGGGEFAFEGDIPLDTL